MNLLRSEINNNGEIKQGRWVLDSLIDAIQNSVQPGDKIVTQFCYDADCNHCHRKVRINPATGEVHPEYVCEYEGSMPTHHPYGTRCPGFDDSLPF